MSTEPQNDSVAAPADPTDRMTLTWTRIREVVDRFEKAWQRLDTNSSNATVHLATFLPPEGDSLRQQALISLIGVELEIRWKRGQVAYLDQYLEAYPELGGVDGLSPKLIYEEYRVRQLYGDKPTTDRYEVRFPKQFPELQKLLAQHPIASPFCTPTLASPSASPSGSTHKNQESVVPVGGGYRLLKRIGSGSYGEVWRAESTASGIEAAIKIVTRPMSETEAQTELQALELIKRMRHPYLLKNITYEPHEEQLYIVMELADGSLRDRMKQCAKETGHGIPRDELIGYMKEAAEALDYLHAEKVHHRDIKPENILLLQKHVKVADFGLARLLESTRSLMSMSVSGTPAYMAPEVWCGKFSPHSDQYSLAVAYAELRLNRRLYPGKAYVELMRFHTEDAPDLSPLPEPEQRALLKALSKNPSERYKTCLEWAQALEEAAKLDQTPGGPTPSHLPPRQERVAKVRPARRWPKRAALAVGMSVLFALGAFVAKSFTKPQATSAPAVKVEPQPGQPLPPPAGFVKIGDETETDRTGRTFYKTIAKEFPNGVQAEFVLIPQDQTKDQRPGIPDLPSYYILKNKVTQRLFRLFAAERPAQIQSQAWDRGADAEDDPVFNVSTDEACRFAEWLGGRLPSRDQWDKATGCFRTGTDRGEGPYRGNWRVQPPPDIAVNRTTGPKKAGEAADDISPLYGVRDMAGNGLEWTRDIMNSSLEAPLSNFDPQEKVLVYLRGKHFEEPEPLQFVELSRIRAGSEVGGAWFYNQRYPSTSFRVVLQPEAPTNQ